MESPDRLKLRGSRFVGLQGKNLSRNVHAMSHPLSDPSAGRSRVFLGSVLRRRPVSSAIVPVQAWHHRRCIGSEHETCAPNTSPSITHDEQYMFALAPPAVKHFVQYDRHESLPNTVTAS
jgi:hypothetical protein